MPNTFYIDPDLGDDSIVNALGWWRVDFTGGTSPAPIVDEIVTGAISGSTAKVTAIGTLTGGSWAAGTAAGTMYFYGKSAAFASEQVNFAGGGHMHITGDFINGAWKTGTLGALAARTAPGDYFLCKKSPPPVSIGDATWTDNSNIITVASGLTVSVETCESNWTADNGSSVASGYSSTSGGFQGSNHLNVTGDSTPGAGERQVWKNIADLNLSAGYDRLNLWFTSSNVILDNQWKICFYDDDLGTNIVDTFLIPAMPAGSQPFVLPREGGGNISGSIRAVGIHYGSSPPAGGKLVALDNLFVSNSSGIDLCSLISKNSTDQGGTEAWFAIGNIVNTSVQIRGYSRIDLWMKYATLGTSPETVTTYIRKCFTVNDPFIIQESGTFSNLMVYKGGFNPETNLQDGVTCLNGIGFGINGAKGFDISKDFIRVDHFYVYNYGYCFYGSTGKYIKVSDCGAFNATWLTYFQQTYFSSFDFLFLAFGAYHLYYGGFYNYFRFRLTTACYYGIATTTSICKNNIFRIDLSLRNRIAFQNGDSVNTVIEYYKSRLNSSSQGVISTNSGDCYIKELDYNETNIANSFGAKMNAQIAVGKSTGIINDPIIIQENGFILKQDATAGGTGKEWKMQINSNATIEYPIYLMVARIYCNPNVNTIISAFFKKSHATGVGAKLICKALQLSGLTSDIESVCPDDTNRNSLSLVVNPAEGGVVEIQALVWFISSNNATVIVDGEITAIES